MRVALHTGKGGVGKTTVAAATALAAAAGGRRTLLLSTDPAHSIADVLEVPIGADPTQVAGVPLLRAAQVDVRGRFEQAWSAVRGYLLDALLASGMDTVQAEELTVLPGADDVVALLELERYVSSADFDVIVLDCAPSGETLRLLALPETLGFYADRVLAAPARLLRGLAGGLAGLAGLAGLPGSRSPGVDGRTRDALADVLRRLSATRSVLTDPTICGIRLVLTPERVVVAEARRLWTALSLHGFPVESVIVNRVLPADWDHPQLAGWRTGQQAALAAVAESFAGLPVRRVALSGDEPTGVVALTRLADELFAGADPLAGAVRTAGPAVRAVAAGYQFRLPLPLVPVDEVELSRSGDDLVVTVGAHRRRISLPAVLRRCRTTGARFDGDTLVVAFEPDAALWPANLPRPGADRAAGRSAPQVPEPRRDLEVAG